jgi:hypothetical protein
MATLAALATEAIAQCGRPDKAALIASAIKHMTFNAHRFEFYPQDRVIAEVTPVSPGNVILEALPTRWRKFASIRPLSDAGAYLDKVFTFRVPENIYDFSGDLEYNYFYVVGSNVYISNYDVTSKFEWVYYADPDLSTDAASTWITNRYEQEIIDGALGYVYKKLGDETTSRTLIDLWRVDHLPRIRADNMLEML